mmetsp:Transcript_23411/g.58562  ORF Transcript_23411/g.58562 Transcript_23411/m.58562 type:complete len:184 (+) Transcript_23411:52-603(+)|eukprot:CAMPEP_0177661000 /NCGR_PEP_ID=MMETSP0447-20121125/18393_1 /TAXON_ID=0 /ORGANISM="Stygamoeba regulata, Strain BSH-02190019" /LENGTH=183 /DNA_ID=CAMNT_0019166209 /DNA_START=28 /DNA_END=579 /DNA_ORIENTATION=+
MARAAVLLALCVLLSVAVAEIVDLGSSFGHHHAPVSMSAQGAYTSCSRSTRLCVGDVCKWKCKFTHTAGAEMAGSCASFNHDEEYNTFGSPAVFGKGSTEISCESHKKISPACCVSNYSKKRDIFESDNADSLESLSTVELTSSTENVEAKFGLFGPKRINMNFIFEKSVPAQKASCIKRPIA